MKRLLKGETYRPTGYGISPKNLMFNKRFYVRALMLILFQDGLFVFFVTFVSSVLKIIPQSI
ncbi:MAG: hypothetical protein LBJ00_15365 [Planctomycetaceae bacterium]|nr:hypothetical protein [Planctomycetaceae bacterium]